MSSNVFVQAFLVAVVGLGLWLAAMLLLPQ